MEVQAIVDRVRELASSMNGVEPTIQLNYPVPEGYSELYRGLVYYNVDYVRWLRILGNSSELIIESISQAGFDRIEQVIISGRGVSIHIAEYHSDYVKESHESDELTPLMRVIYVLVKALTGL